MVSNEIITCPFCGETYPFSTEFEYNNNLDNSCNIGNGNKCYFNIDGVFEINYKNSNRQSVYEATIARCPYCNEEYLQIKFGSIHLYNFKEEVDSQLINVIRPKSIHKVFPDYVPKAIRKDYEEACSILDFSPKAAATLARRALEGMILDYWQISAKSKGSLKREIDELQGKIPSKQWDAIDALRKLGNIGAHMENDTSVIVDIDPGEAEKLLMLIEHLVQQWYVARHEEEELYNKIVDINDEKEKERKNAGIAPT